MFDVSRTILAVIAALAIVLLVLGLATGLGLFGWVAAIILGAYVIAAVWGRTRPGETRGRGDQA